MEIGLPFPLVLSGAHVEKCSEMHCQNGGESSTKGCSGLSVRVDVMIRTPYEMREKRDEMVD